MGRTDTNAVAPAPLPLHAYLTPFPLVCFAGALVTDITYSRTSAMQWANFSAWLLAIGLAFAVLAAIAGVIGHVLSRRTRHAFGWVHGVGYLLVLVLALFDNLVHARDAWTSVVPTGLMLSAATVVVMLATVALDHSLARGAGGELR